jgi:Anti-sigma factor NepR
MKERTRQPPEEPMPQTDKLDRLEESPKGRLSRDVQRKIGQQLRSMYTDVVNEGVPDRFAELLRRLDEKKQ